MPAPGMAAKHAFDSQIRAPENAPLLDGLDRVMRTGWAVTALARPQQWRQGVLVDADGQDEELFEQPHKHTLNKRQEGRF